MIASVKNPNQINKQSKTKVRSKSNFDKKFFKLKKSIFIFFIFIIILVAAITYSFNGFIKTYRDLSIKEASLQSQVNNITEKIDNLDNKSKIAVKYVAIWNKLSEKKKAKDPVKLTEAGNILKDIAKRNGIQRFNVNFSTPVKLDGFFTKETVDIYSVLILIDFSALTDIDVYNFLEEIDKELPNFIMPEELTIKKVGNIDQDYLIALAKGVLIPTLDVTMNIRWYIVTDKTN